MKRINLAFTLCTLGLPLLIRNIRVIRVLLTNYDLFERSLDILSRFQAVSSEALKKEQRRFQSATRSPTNRRSFRSPTNRRSFRRNPEAYLDRI